jgi:5-methylcytosine-specific restriction endonuclease McrA
MSLLLKIQQAYRVRRRTQEILDLLRLSDTHQWSDWERRTYQRKARGLAKVGASDQVILQALRAAMQKPASKQPLLKHDGHCTICKSASSAPICLVCAKKYRGEIQRVQAQKHRAKKAGALATLTIAEWLQTLETFHHLCAYCQATPYEVMEHYVPIARGGGTTAENCIPACTKCNAEKSDKHPEPQHRSETV